MPEKQKKSIKKSITNQIQQKSILNRKIMKKLAFVSACVLSLALAGSVTASTTLVRQDQVKKEAPAAKKNEAKEAKEASTTKKEVKKAPEKKMVNQKDVKKPAEKKAKAPENK
jgi:hypothetical protein